MTENDRKFLSLAVKLAYEHIGYTKINPLVGAVVTYKDQVIGEGAHHQPKTPHAEAIALNNATNHPLYKIKTENPEDWSNNTTIYVTLEPCGHYGSNPPCVNAIKEHNIGRVVYSTPDPNPITSGKGPEYLKSCGIEVIGPTYFPDADELTHDFRTSILSKKSYLAIKVATSIDARMATCTLDSKWISNEQSRGFAHYLRQRYDAICVGINTVAIDNPKLTVRKEIIEKYLTDPNLRFNIRQPIVVIIDPHLKILEPHNQFIDLLNQPERKIIVVSKRLPESTLPKNVEVLINSFFEDTNELDWSALRASLYKMNIGSILVEGGSKTFSAIVNQAEYDRLYYIQAPILLGPKALSFTSNIKSPKFVKEAIKMNFVDSKRLGDDLVITYERNLLK